MLIPIGISRRVLPYIIHITPDGREFASSPTWFEPVCLVIVREISSDAATMLFESNTGFGPSGVVAGSVPNRMRKLKQAGGDQIGELELSIRNVTVVQGDFCQLIHYHAMLP